VQRAKERAQLRLPRGEQARDLPKCHVDQRGRGVSSADLRKEIAGDHAHFGLWCL
jgi:hypothetical protein